MPQRLFNVIYDDIQSSYKNMTFSSNSLYSYTQNPASERSERAIKMSKTVKTI